MIIRILWRRARVFHSPVTSEFVKQSINYIIAKLVGDTPLPIKKYTHRRLECFNRDNKIRYINSYTLYAIFHPLTTQVKLRLHCVFR